MGDDLEQLEKSFEVFSKGVERLQAIEQELNNLDTNGFEKEVNQIRTELHNVAEIPKIEQQLQDLKTKIQNKYLPTNGFNGNSLVLKKFDQYVNKILGRFESRLNKRMDEINEQIKELKNGIGHDGHNGHQTNEMVKLRINANLDKLEFIQTMPTLMNKINESESTKQCFDYLVNFYQNFRKAIEEQSDLEHYQTIEQQLEAHLEYFNKLVINLSKASYNYGGKEYEDLKSHLKASERITRNPYYANITMNLI